MNKHLSLESIFLTGILFLSSCDNSHHHVLSYTTIGNDTLYTCDVQAVSDEKDMKLSDLIESFHIVRFENTDTALFKTWKVYISDHYIGILEPTQPFKLFDHSGNYLCDVGGIGQAEGEYTMLYSGTINEKDSAIWLAPFSGTRLWKYNMQGKCTATIPIANMHKPVIRCEKDNTLTATNLYFRDMPRFLYLRVLSNDSVYYSINETQYAYPPRDKNGNFSGYNHEIWFHNNTEDFVYMTTMSDTLLTYDILEDKTIPRFTISPKTLNSYYTFDEMPGYFLINIWEELRKQIFIDKASGKASYVKIQNDFMGNLPVNDFAPNDGWYYQMFEPIELIELIEQTLSDKQIKSADKIILEEFLSSVNENDNNILFMGKLSNKNLYK